MISEANAKSEAKKARQAVKEAPVAQLACIGGFSGAELLACESLHPGFAHSASDHSYELAKTADLDQIAALIEEQPCVADQG